MRIIFLVLIAGWLPLCLTLSDDGCKETTDTLLYGLSKNDIASSTDLSQPNIDHMLKYFDAIRDIHLEVCRNKSLKAGENATEESTAMGQGLYRYLLLFKMTAGLMIHKDNTALMKENFEIEIQVVSVVFALTFLLGTTGNLLVFIAVLKRSSPRVTRNFTNLLLASLAAADFLLVFLCLPIKEIEMFFQAWPFGAAMCKGLYYIRDVSFVSSVFSLVVITIERYYAIRHPLKARYYYTTQRARRLILVVWVLSLIASIPGALVMKHNTLVSGFVCVARFDNNTYEQLYYLYKCVILFMAPVLAMGICYGLMCWELTRTRPVSISAGGRPGLQHNSRKHSSSSNSPRIHNRCNSAGTFKGSSGMTPSDRVSPSVNMAPWRGVQRPSCSSTATRVVTLNSPTGGPSCPQLPLYGKASLLSPGCDGIAITPESGDPFPTIEDIKLEKAETTELIVTEKPNERPSTLALPVNSKIVEDKGERRERHKTLSTSQASQQGDGLRKKVIKMFIAIVAVFVICWGPYLLYEVLYRFHVFNTHTHDRNLWRSVLATMTYINSCINPIIYAFMYRDYKKFLRNIFGRFRAFLMDIFLFTIYYVCCCCLCHKAFISFKSGKTYSRQQSANTDSTLIQTQSAGGPILKKTALKPRKLSVLQERHCEDAGLPKLSQSDQKHRRSMSPRSRLSYDYMMEGPNNFKRNVGSSLRRSFCYGKDADCRRHSNAKTCTTNTLLSSTSGAN